MTCAICGRGCKSGRLRRKKVIHTECWSRLGKDAMYCQDELGNWYTRVDPVPAQ